MLHHFPSLINEAARVMRHKCDALYSADAACGLLWLQIILVKVDAIGVNAIALQRHDAF